MLLNCSAQRREPATASRFSAEGFSAMAAEAVVGLWLAVAVGLASTLPVDIADYRAAKGRRRGVSELIFRCLFLCFAMLALCDALGSNKPTSNIPRLSSLLIRQGDPEQPSIDKPTTPPTTAPPATTAAAGTGGTAGSDGKSGGSNGGVRTGRNDDDQPTYIKPTLDECGAALQRMQVVLLLELLFECIAVIAVCLLSRDKNAKKFLRMWSTTLLLIYVIPVILLNVSVIWLGGAPTGSCKYMQNILILGVGPAHVEYLGYSAIQIV